jgi:hypothetical protein
MSRLKNMSDQDFAHLGKVGERATAPLPMFLTYSKEKGGFYVVGKEITDSEWIAAPDACLVVWTRFGKNRATGKPEVKEIRKAFATDTTAFKNGKPNRPDTHTDMSEWEIDTKDPNRERTRGDQGMSCRCSTRRPARLSFSGPRPPRPEKPLGACWRTLREPGADLS